MVCLQSPIIIIIIHLSYLIHQVPQSLMYMYLTEQLISAVDCVEFPSAQLHPTITSITNVELLENI